MSSFFKIIYIFMQDSKPVCTTFWTVWLVFRALSVSYTFQLKEVLNERWAIILSISQMQDSMGKAQTVFQTLNGLTHDLLSLSKNNENAQMIVKEFNIKAPAKTVK